MQLPRVCCTRLLVSMQLSFGDAGQHRCCVCRSLSCVCCLPTTTTNSKWTLVACNRNEQYLAGASGASARRRSRLCGRLSVWRAHVFAGRRFVSSCAKTANCCSPDCLRAPVRTTPGTLDPRAGLYVSANASMPRNFSIVLGTFFALFYFCVGALRIWAN